MKVTLTNDACIVEREPDDIVYPNNHYGESRLWYHIKQALIKQGHDVVKKLMVKDGHMTSEGVYYIRQRKWEWCLLDEYYAIRLLSTAFNERERIILRRETW